MAEGKVVEKKEEKGLPQGVKGGLICIIVGASISLFITLIVGLIYITGTSLLSKMGSKTPSVSSAVKIAATIIGIVFLILSILPILTIVFASLALQGKNERYILASVFGILFGGIVGLIGGILVLVNKNNDRIQ